MLTTKTTAGQLARIVLRERLARAGCDAGDQDGDYETEIVTMVVAALDSRSKVDAAHQHSADPHEQGPGWCAACDAAAVLSFLRESDVTLLGEMFDYAEDNDWFYLSFADVNRPEGEQFLGGAYVQASTVERAVTRAHALGINPGGEVQAHGPIPRASLAGNVPVEDRERLLSRAELGA